MIENGGFYGFRFRRSKMGGEFFEYEGFFKIRKGGSSKIGGSLKEGGVFEETLYLRRTSHLRFSTAKIEEHPPIFARRSRRLGRRSPLFPRWEDRSEDQRFQSSWEDLEKLCRGRRSTTKIVLRHLAEEIVERELSSKKRYLRRHLPIFEDSPSSISKSSSSCRLSDWSSEPKIEDNMFSLFSSTRR